ncbi:hypothetical protein LC087_06120 [Bacillus carboniphilus]|uniref:Uncharacterized protein n=1 Tax=Bacillus carboniphilus TaxID=86663 RepID=A0ABY9JZ38_9BACI|nr:hypothetical protein [Bacillus carboniphilus]WLR43710.1 hypothetical protein LC087_06120 [Bacillus carboniphilus]
MISLDKRMISTKYGEHFIMSIPEVELIEKTIEELKETVGKVN